MGLSRVSHFWCLLPRLSLTLNLRKRFQVSFPGLRSQGHSEGLALSLKPGLYSANGGHPFSPGTSPRGTFTGLYSAPVNL